MKQMFDTCTKLCQIEISINTSKVTDMSLIFNKCFALEVLDLSRWDTKNVTTMNSMFKGCITLGEIIGLDKWDLSSLKGSSFMFQNCKGLTQFDGISEWNTSSITNFEMYVPKFGRSRRIS